MISKPFLVRRISSASGRVAWGHDRLEEAGPDRPRGRVVDHPVGADDPPVGRYGVALEGQPERLRQVDHRGQAARVAVLHDADGGRLEVAGDLPGGVQVEQVVEGEVLAGNLPRSADGGAALGGIGVEGAQLVRVLAIAQVRLLLDHQRQPAREEGAGLRVEVRGDLGVIRGGQGERLRRQLLARLGADRAMRLDISHDRCVLGRVRDRRHAREVLGRGAQERHAADVDLLQRLVQGRARLRHRLPERVEVDHHHVDLLDAVLGQLGEVVRLVTPRQQPREDLGVERLDSAAQDLGRIGQVGDRLDGNAGFGEVGPGPVGGVALDAGLGEALRQLDDPFAVRDGEDCAQRATSNWTLRDGDLRGARRPGTRPPRSGQYSRGPC